MIEVTAALSNKFKNTSFLCACLVVLIHISVIPNKGSALWWISGLVGGGLARVAVPFFFFSAGFFLGGKYNCGATFSIWKKEVFKRVGTLVVPYCIWNIAFFLFAVVVGWSIEIFGVSSGFKVMAHSTCYDWLTLMGLNIFTASAHSALWFVRCLFFFVVLSPLLLLFVRSCRAFWGWLTVFIFVGMLMMFVDSKSDLYACLRWRISPDGLLYFCLGMGTRLGIFRIPRFFKFFGRFGLLFAMAIALLRLAFGLSGNEFLAWIMIACAMYGLWRIVPSKSWPESLVGNAFALYLVHPFFIVILAAIFSVLSKGLLNSSVMLYLVRWFVAIGTSLLLIVAFRKFMPKGTRFVLGGR